MKGKRSRVFFCLIGDLGLCIVTLSFLCLPFFFALNYFIAHLLGSFVHLRCIREFMMVNDLLCNMLL